MRRKKLWGYMAAAILSLGAAVGQGAFAYAEESANETKTYSDVDKSKGVEYVEAGTGSDTSAPGYNLNGNSVIIKKSDNSTDTSVLLNFYNDKDMDGIVDDGETMFEIDGSTDIPLKDAYIYGVYDGYKASEPISITVDCADIACVYGVYNGQTTGDVTVNIVNEAAVQNAWGVYGGSADGAVKVNVSGSAVVSGALFGAYGDSTVGSMAVDLSGSANVSSLYAALGRDGECVIKGDVDVRVGDSATLSSATLVSKTTISGNLDIDIEDTANAGEFTGTQASYVAGNVTFDAAGGTKYGSLSLVSSASAVDGDVTANLSNDGEGSPYVSIVTSGYMEEKGYTVGGEISCSANGGRYGGFYAVNNGAYAKKGVTAKLTNADINGTVYGAGSSAIVDGDVSVILQGGTIGNYCTVFGANSAKKIGGNLTFEAKGFKGEYTGIYGTYSSEIGGNVDIDVVGSGTFNITSGAYYGSVGGYADIDITGIGEGQIYGTQNTNIGGYVDVDITGYTGRGDVYGVYNGKIGGAINVDLTGCTTSGGYLMGVYGIASTYKRQDTDPEYVNVVNIKNCSGYNTSGVDYSSGMDMISVTIDNVKSSGYLYGVRNASGASGKVKSYISGATSTYDMYAYYGSYNSTSETGLESMDVSVSGSTSESAIYPAYMAKITGDLNVAASNNVCKSMQTASVNVGGNYTADIDYININSESEQVVSGTNVGSGSFYGLTYSTVGGSVTMDISHIHFADMSVCGSSYSTIGGDFKATVSDSSFDSTSTSAYMYVMAESSSTSDKDVGADITFTNVDFSGMTSVVVNNIISSHRKADITFTDCKLPASYTVYASGNRCGTAVIKIGGDIYYGGMMTIDSDVTADNIHFGTDSCNAYIGIAKGVTITAAQGVYIGAYGHLLNEGTINGTFKREATSKGLMYIKGGNFADTNASNEVNIYYPVTLNYNESAVSIATTGIGTMPLDTATRYAATGSEFTVTPTINKGYTLDKVTFRGVSETSSSEAVLSSGAYVVTMPGENCVVDVVTNPLQIRAGKTVADPSIILNNSYTSENPVYDMADVNISNDAKNGTVTYEVDDVYGLPEGLALSEGFITGTPTVAYEDGKKVVIHITGKNGSQTTISLNLIVSAAGKTQDNNDGRISVDEENKQIELNGTSVVVMAAEGEESVTAIYADDNKDGEVDSAAPMYSGDISEYSIVGLSDTETKKSIRITMKSGSVGAIYGAMSSEVTGSNGDAVTIDIQGGKVSGKVYVAYNSTVDGTVAFKYVKDSVSGYNMQTGSTVTGSWRECDGAVTIAGEYDVTEAVEATRIYADSNASVVFENTVKASDEVYMNTGSTAVFKSSLETALLDGYSKVNVTLEGQTRLTEMSFGYYDTYITIGEKAYLDVDKVKLGATYSSVYVYHRGTAKVSADNFTNKGKWVVIGGKFADDVDESSLSRLYYVSSISTNMSDVKAEILVSESGALTFDDEIYVMKNGSTKISYTEIDGYTAYISADGGDPVTGSNGLAYISNPGKNMEFRVDYIADQISLEKRYADPTAFVGTTYTEESPLYDLAGVNVSGDTTANYGTDKTYRLKSGSSLPDGLTLADGKIIGTLTESSVSTDAVFVITGRNGTSAEVTLTVTVEKENTGFVDLNDVITNPTVSVINLEGQSVVLLADTEDSKKTSIYPDADHDGLADNNIALKIDGASSYDLSKCDIYGYNKVGEELDGDITIYMYGGKLRSLYGVYGDGKADAKRASISGTVSMYLIGGTITDEVIAAKYANVKAVTFSDSGTNVQESIYGSVETSMDTMDFSFADGAQMLTTSQYDTLSMYVMSGGETAGDVKVNLGLEGSEYPFAYKSGAYSGRVRYGGLYGVKDAVVGGDVYYTVEGQWYSTERMNMLYNTDVTGDLIVDMKSGRFTSGGANHGSKSFVYEGSVANVRVSAGESGAVSDSVIVTAACKVGNIDYSDTNAGSNATVTYISENLMVTHNGYLYGISGNELTLGGKYTLDKDISAKNISIISGADITVAEGVTMTVSGTAEITGTLTNNGTLNTQAAATITGKLVNNGTWNISADTTLGSGTLASTVDNYGTVSGGSTNTIKLSTTYARLINRESGIFTFGKMTGSGTLVNYGKLTQTATTTVLSSGYILTSTLPGLYNAKYNNIYFKADVDYPAYCFDGTTEPAVTIAASSTSYQKSSGVDGDTDIYIRGGASFKTVIAGTLLENMAVESVVYGEAENKCTSSNNVTWTGTMPYEPMTATVNIKDNTATTITLSKDSDTVDGAQVGVTTTLTKPLYDVTAIEIQNDSAVEGASVVYSLASGQKLPEGLVLNGGKIYGTPTTASDEAASVVIRVRGMNQTIAEFVLVIDGIDKGVPTIPNSLVAKADAGTTLADVKLPVTSYGDYTWADETQQVGDAGTTVYYDAYYAPKDTENYDWSKLDETVGTYDADKKTVSVKIAVTIRKQTPKFTVPSDVKAVYGETLADVEIPAAENGTFEWKDGTLAVGTPGTRTFAAVFVPSDESVYERVDVNISVTVDAAKAEFTNDIVELKAKEGDTLADIELPEREDGTYTWYTDRTTSVQDGGQYKLCFKPADTTNYDWTGVSGWNRSYKGVVFTVKVTIQSEHVHDYGDAYKSDKDKHWLECSCGEKSGEDAHTWDKGEVTKAATSSADGVKTYKCTVCGYLRNEVIPKLKTDISSAKISYKSSMSYTGSRITQKTLVVKVDGKSLVMDTDYKVVYSNNRSVGTAVMTITGIGNYTGSVKKTFTIKITNGACYRKGTLKYKVTSNKTDGNGTVTLLSSSNKKLASLTIPATVTISGKSFKVTAVGDSAFKSFTQLKTVTMGSNVKRIGKRAFYGCKSLTTVNLGTSTTRICAYAFSRCVALTTVKSGANVVVVEDYAFYGCTSIKSMPVGRKVTSIGKYAFYNCKAMTSVGRLSKVKTIGAKAFAGCSKLKSVVITSTNLKTVGAKAFGSTYSKIKFTLPKATSKYRAYVKLIKAAGAPAKAVYVKAR